jgi:hypothetical protein
MATVADDTMASAFVNRMLDASVANATVLNQQLIRANADDEAFAMDSRRRDAMTAQLVTYVGAQALLGSDPTLAATILAQRSAGAQPQSGGGPGQPVTFPVQQQLPGAPAVYSISPTTGAITKA